MAGTRAPVSASGRMRALSKVRSEPGLWMESRAVPEIGPADVLVKVAKTGICGTDMHIYKWDNWARATVPVPMVVGHEYVGRIVEVGSAVEHLKVGQRVSGEGHVIGHRGRASRSGRFHHDPDVRGIGVNMPGAFADYVRVPAFNIVPLPDEIDDEIAAILDPLGNAVHTALSFDLVGEDVLITGAGPIGIMSAMIARHCGAGHVVITDVNPARLALAGRIVDAVAVDAREGLAPTMERLGMSEGFDVGFEMSGSQAAFEQMVGSLVPGGKVSFLGIPSRPFPVDWGALITKMITIKCIYGREMFDTWHKMIAMLRAGLDVRPVITHRFAVADYEQAFALMSRAECGKVVLDWN